MELYRFITIGETGSDPDMNFLRPTSCLEQSDDLRSAGGRPGLVHPPAIDTARYIREIDPLEETVSSARSVDVSRSSYFAITNYDDLPGLNGIYVTKSGVLQCRGFACRGE